MRTTNCTTCGGPRDYVIKSGKRAGKLQNRCRKCLSAQVVDWAKRNPEKSLENQRRYWEKHPRRYVRANMKKFGTDEVWYFAKHDEQHGVCAICERPEWSLGNRLDGKPRRLAVDHCHKTNGLRGLLCTGCNTKVATLEMHDWLAKATVYLAKYRTAPKS